MSPIAAICKACRELCRERDAADFRRGANRHRTDRDPLRVRAIWWDAARHHDAGQGVGGGVPIGARRRPTVARAFGPGTHASTFGGNPLACAAALAVLRVLLDGRFSIRGRRMGECLAKGLATWKERHRCVKEVGARLAARYGVGD